MGPRAFVLRRAQLFCDGAHLRRSALLFHMVIVCIFPLSDGVFEIVIEDTSG